MVARPLGSVVDADGGSASSCDYAHIGISRQGGLSLEALAAQVQQHALCTCAGLSMSAPLSVLGPGARARVQVDAEMSLGADSSVDGDLNIAGSAGVTLGEMLLTVGQSLSVGGDLLGAGARVEVSGDARIAGEIQLEALNVSGELQQSAVTVAPACPCDDRARIDATPLGGDDWPMLELDAAPTNLATPCSALQLVLAPAIEGHITAQGDAMLLVDSDLAADGDLSVEVAAGHTLDLIVEGNLRVDGQLKLGDTQGGRVRLFVTGSGTVQLQGGAELHGLLHAPDAELVLSAPLELHGSALVRRVASQAELRIHARDPP